ncbi:MAG: hypothetical protein FWD42_10115, partial [Solirubrobacterales bacterium]|nr:hypothetical protein [Solirubrobacterales bacterium]
MYVAPAPELHDLIARVASGRPERIAELLQRHGAVENGLDYVHWDKLRELTPPDGIDHEEWWLLIKLARRPLLRAIPLTDPQGEPFVYATPDVVARHL